MDQELTKYYDSLVDMFASDGWKEFMSDNSASLSSLVDNAYMDCRKSKDWHKRRGEIEQLSRIVNYEDFIRQSLEQLEAEDDSV